MKLFYDLRIITIAPDQWHHHRPWPIRLAELLAALLAWLLITTMRTEHTIRVAAATTSATAESYAAAIRVVATAAQVASRVAWDDLSYGVAGALLGNAMDRRLSLLVY